MVVEDITLTSDSSVFEKNSKTVKEMDKDQQPREKAELYGVEVLSVSELWALILRAGSPGYPITELCRDLMKKNGDNLHRLERRSINELCEMKGLGRTKALQIMAVMELIKKYGLEDIPMEDPIRSSNQVYELMKHKIGNLNHEEIWMLLLNRRNQIMKMIKVTSGTSTSSVFDNKQAIKYAILENAEGIILCHNHPSNNIQPSPQDDNLTQNFKEACRIMNIKLLNHIIVTSKSFYSYNDSGRL